MRADRLLLQDILEAIDAARKYLPSQRAAFDADPPLQSHILRQVQIIGEAAWRLSPELKVSPILAPASDVARQGSVTLASVKENP